jgi:hypothetical protein
MTSKFLFFLIYIYNFKLKIVDSKHDGEDGLIT